MSLWRFTTWFTAALLAVPAANTHASEPVTNSVGMTLVRIDAGRFQMGSLDGNWDERPVHAVVIRHPFLLGATEVTNAQYEQFDPEHHRLRGKLGFSQDDMHDNVEEWCGDWYGPYVAATQTDPIGRAAGDFRVTRGGSHSTTLEFLRSANRSGTLPEDKSWLIGFRVVQGHPSATAALPAPEAPRYARNVKQTTPPDLTAGPDSALPYFRGPRQYVQTPTADECPVFNRHSHCPAVVNCPNGDLLAIWYTCRNEPGRELGIVASRLPNGADEWQVASNFWDGPDRNDHASALWVDEQGTLYHFNGLSARPRGAAWPPFCGPPATTGLPGLRPA